VAISAMTRAVPRAAKTVAGDADRVDPLFVGRVGELIEAVSTRMRRPLASLGLSMPFSESIDFKFDVSVSTSLPSSESSCPVLLPIALVSLKFGFPTPPTNRSSTVAVGILFFATQFATSTHRGEIAHAEEIVGTRLSKGRRSKLSKA
jgi:hypothetical protein